MAGSVAQPVRSIIAPSRLRQIGSSTELWKFAGSRMPRWNAAIARWASSTWRVSVVFRWSVINASNSISRPAWTGKQRSPVESSCRFGHKRTQSVQNIEHDDTSPVTSEAAPALAENGLLGNPFPNSPLRAAVSRFGSVRIGTNIGASKPRASGPFRRAAARLLDAHIDVVSFHRPVPNHCPTKICAGLPDIDDGYVHDAERKLMP